MRPIRRLAAPAALLLGALLLLPLAGCGGEDAATGPTLRFSGIPDQDATRLVERFEPVARYLEAKLGVPVRYVPTVDYKASVEAFVNADIQLAWFGGLTGVQAQARVPGARAIAQGASDPQFKSFFIAHASTGLERSRAFPKDAKGKTFTFGSPSSTSGRLMPEYFVREETGLAPDAFFQTVAFQKNHDQTVEAVASGAVQVGAVNFKVYERRVREGETDPEVCRVIWETPTYADYNFTAHPVLEERFGAGFLERLQAALLEMKDPALLAALERPEGLVAASNEDLAKIRSVATELGFLDPR